MSRPSSDTRYPAVSSSKRKLPRLLGAFGVLFAALASSCCLVPIVLGALGITAAGIGSAMAPLRPYALVAMFGLVSAAIWLSYRDDKTFDGLVIGMGAVALAVAFLLEFH